MMLGSPFWASLILPKQIGFFANPYFNVVHLLGCSMLLSRCARDDATPRADPAQLKFSGKPLDRPTGVGPAFGGPGAVLDVQARRGPDRRKRCPNQASARSPSRPPMIDGAAKEDKAGHGGRRRANAAVQGSCRILPSVVPAGCADDREREPLDASAPRRTSLEPRPILSGRYSDKVVGAEAAFPDQGLSPEY